MKSYVLQSALERYLQPIDPNMSIYYGDAMDLSNDNGLDIAVNQLGFLYKFMSGDKYKGQSARVYLLYNSTQTGSESIMTAREKCADIEDTMIKLQNQSILTRNDVIRDTNDKIRFNTNPDTLDDGITVVIRSVSVVDAMKELGKGPDGHQQYYMVVTITYSIGDNHYLTPSSPAENEQSESGTATESGTDVVDDSTTQEYNDEQSDSNESHTQED